MELASRKIDMLAGPSMGNTRLLNFFRYMLKPSESLEIDTGQEEHAIDILSGSCSVYVETKDSSKQKYENIGGRENIFSGMPEFVYIPRGARYIITCTGGNLEAGVCTAVATRDSYPLYVPAKDVKKKVSGTSDWERDVYTGLGEGGPSTMIFMGETDSPLGNWSGYPPHKHSENNPPIERPFEEIYYFKFMPATGFALGGVYSDYRCRRETSKVTMVGDSQMFCAPSGYHFIAPCPGYKLRYIWMLGGDTVGFGQWEEDPDYKWLLDYKE